MCFKTLNWFRKQSRIKPKPQSRRNHVSSSQGAVIELKGQKWKCGENVPSEHKASKQCVDILFGVRLWPNRHNVLIFSGETASGSREPLVSKQKPEKMDMVDLNGTEAAISTKTSMESLEDQLNDNNSNNYCTRANGQCSLPHLFR